MSCDRSNRETDSRATQSPGSASQWYWRKRSAADRLPDLPRLWSRRAPTDARPYPGWLSVFGGRTPRRSRVPRPAALAPAHLARAVAATPAGAVCGTPGAAAPGLPNATERPALAPAGVPESVGTAHRATRPAARTARRQVCHRNRPAGEQHRCQPPPQLARHRELRSAQTAKTAVHPSAAQGPQGGRVTGAGRAARISDRHSETRLSTLTPAAPASRWGIGSVGVAINR